MITTSLSLSTDSITIDGLISDDLEIQAAEVWKHLVDYHGRYRVLHHDPRLLAGR